MARYHYPNFFRRYHRDDVMSTITAAFKPENAAVWHPIHGRIYSVREIGTFQSFPRDFIFHGSTIKSKYQQIGNAIPPYFMKKLGERLRPFLLGEFESIERILPDSNLLNVNQPISKQKPEIYDLIQEFRANQRKAS